MTHLDIDKDLIGKKGSRFEIATPALILDLDALEQNILVMAQLARKYNVKLRPHCKSHKSVYIASLQKEAGAIGISCATLGEAEEMIKGKIEGVLITSPIVLPRKISQLIELNKTAENLMVVVDSVENVQVLARANAKNDKPLQVLIDFDVGQQRTGVKNMDAALFLAEEIKQHRSLKYIGIQAYAGHLQHIADYEERQKLMSEQNKRIRELCQALEEASMKPSIITGGGTGTFDIDCKAGLFTELQVGSYLFMDVEYNEVSFQRDTACPFTPSLFVATSIISDNENTFITDGGLKAFATDGPNPKVFSGAPRETVYQFMGDEHGKLGLPEGSKLFLGDRLECLTPHCDPTINLYDTYHCVRGDTLENIWPVNARGMH